MYLYLGIALLSLIPLVWLYRSYQRTGIQDFLLFSGLFLSVFINNITWANIISDYPIVILEYVMITSYLLHMAYIVFPCISCKMGKKPTNPLVFDVI